jgi:hypothetical protein
MDGATESPPGNEKAARQDGSFGAQKEDSAKITHGAEKVKWATQAHCLWLEFLRTGDLRHLAAFRRHRAAMGGRLRSRE